MYIDLGLQSKFMIDNFLLKTGKMACVVRIFKL